VPKPLPLVECATPLAGSPLSDEEAAELERLLRTIADRTRLRILNILIRARGAPVCVCEFVPESVWTRCSAARSPVPR
jgi:ArsR family transcriptional regulator